MDVTTEKSFTIKERPYKCPHCETKFTHDRNMKRHISTVHEGRRDFKCGDCQQSFGSKQDWQRHCQRLGHNYESLIYLKSELGEKSTSVESMLRLLGSKEEGSSEIAHDDTNYEPMEQEESDVEDHLVTDNAGEITPTRKSKRLIETPEISQYAKKPKESHTKGCCVLYCTPSNRSKDVTYHRIPVGKRDIWWKLAGRKDQISADPRICSDHFTQDSFRSGTTIRQLMKNATPTLSLELPVQEKNSAVADMQIGLSSPSKKLPILTSGPIIYSTSTPIAGRNVSYIPMVKNDKSPSKVIVPSIRKKKMPQEDPKIFRYYYSFTNYNMFFLS